MLICREMKSNWEKVRMVENEYALGALVEPLCLWYKENKRSMPWREEASPYHIWLSEIMLQQTRIEAAWAYYERFIKRLPDVKALAEVSEEELLKLWEGLGYYNRARNLQKAARLVMERYDGQLPADYDLLLTLPGIGNYTAGAIASIAYGVPAPAVDGNVLRVAMRYLNCEDDIMKMSVRRRMEQAVMEVIPSGCPGEFNQAFMELGEVICIPNGRPLCERCPLQEQCQGHKAGREMELPKKAEKKARRVEKKTILVFRQGEKVGIRQRSSSGLLAGMWEFPAIEGHKTWNQMQQWLVDHNLQEAQVKKMKGGKHIFSHVEWHMRGYEIVLPEGQTQDVVSGLLWCEGQELQSRYPVPVAFHTFLQQLPPISKTT